MVSVPHAHAVHTAYNSDALAALPPNAIDVPEPFAAVFQPVKYFDDVPVPLVIAQVCALHTGALHPPSYVQIIYPPTQVPEPPLLLTVTILSLASSV